METKQITQFTFFPYDPEIIRENYPITLIQDENGNPWWVAKEVCDVLGFDRVDNALRGLDADEKQVVPLNPHNMRGQGGARFTSIINEPGLYSLILRSRKPEAKAFKRWVTHEVIPSIRKTGGYIHGASEMSEMEIMAAAQQIAERTIEEQRRRLEEAKPKVEAYDHFIDADGLLNLSSTAKVLGVGPIKLCEALREKRGNSGGKRAGGRGRSEEGIPRPHRDKAPLHSYFPAHTAYALSPFLYILTNRRMVALSP